MMRTKRIEANVTLNEVQVKAIWQALAHRRDEGADLDKDVADLLNTLEIYMGRLAEGR